MSVAFCLNDEIIEIGSSDFLKSFFYTISYHLEPDGWGTRYPELVNDLYDGKAEASKAIILINSLQEIRTELKQFPPDEIIWDIYNLESKPPWGNNISSDITSLSNYFVTGLGEDLFDVFIQVLEKQVENGGDLTLIPC